MHTYTKTTYLKIFSGLIIFLALVFLALIFTPSLTLAQIEGPEFMVTWKSNNYAPSQYAGKILPTVGSVIEVGVDLIDNGKIVDISKNEIRWLVNGRNLQSGIGLKTISFEAEQFRNTQKVLITVVGYKDTSATTLIEVPIVGPEVVITTNQSRTSAPRGLVELKALLYFFNITNINQVSFNWSANGRSAQGVATDPTRAELDTTGAPTNTSIRVGLTVANLLNPSQSAQRSVNLNIR